MTTYYYDKESRTLLAVTEHGAVSILEPVNPSVDGQVAEPPVQKSPKMDAPKFTKGCPECASISKHKTGCSRPPKAEHSKAEYYASGGRKPVKRAPCSECGSKGNRHKKNCSKSGQEQSLTGNDAWAALDKEEKKRADLMSSRQYGQVKTAHTHGMDPTSIAHEMGLRVKEVNTAILSESFETYSQ